MVACTKPKALFAPLTTDDHALVAGSKWNPILGGLINLVHYTKHDIQQTSKGVLVGGSQSKDLDLDFLENEKTEITNAIDNILKSILVEASEDPNRVEYNLKMCSEDPYLRQWFEKGENIKAISAAMRRYSLPDFLKLSQPLML